MTLLVVGANHLSAPNDLLETLAAHSPEGLAQEALSSHNVAETLVVSTCNRVEIYAEVDRFHAAVEDIVSRLAKSSGLTIEDLTAACYVHYDERAMQHLFEVASGLDSMVVGEAQILGQVRSALGQAQELGTAGRELNELGQVALRVGKKVRSTTGLERAGASVVTVGLAEAFEELATKGGPSISGTNVLVLGAGAMSSLTVSHCTRSGVASVVIASRTVEKVKGLAASYGATAAEMSELPELLINADLVVCCAGARGLLVTYADAAAAVDARSGRPLVVLDLSLPHDSDPAIIDLAGVVRVDIAALAHRPETRADQHDVLSARAIVADELSAFAATKAARAVEPVLTSLRGRASAVVEAEIQRLRERLAGLSPEQWALIEQSMRRTVNTLMHTPTVRIKELATDPEGQRYADALTSLFDLSVDLVDQVILPREADPEADRDGRAES